jgi:hypothetical protein
MKLMYSVHLSNLLNVHDINAINLYLARQPKMGIHILDRHFAIRKSNGLVSFSRIDIYVSLRGMIFLSSVEEDNTSPISIELDVL